MFKHNFPFDPTYGYDLERLRQITPPSTPPDFSAFWRRTYDATRATPLRLEARPSSITHANFDVFDVEFDGLDGFRVGAWVTIPKGIKPERGFVRGHGYGEPTGPELWNVGQPAAAIFPCGRGLGRSAGQGAPRIVAEHVIHGIDSRETYIHRGCVADMWSAISALIEFMPTVKNRIDFIGGSFGGGIGALALPWEERFHKAYLSVPSFGHHPLRLTMQCNGSGESVRQYAMKNPRIAREVLPYFDAAIAAQFISTPTLVAPALFDPAVPPPGQFAVYNAMNGKHALHVMPAGHFEYKGIGAAHDELNRVVEAWFA